MLRKLPTGYHQIETGFCFLDWSDTIEARLRSNSDKLHCETPDIPVDGSNLILKSLDQLRKYIALKEHFDITLTKKIPAGAGLGGGSSNAASMLRIANKAAGLPVSDEDLAELSAGLGADVPLFLKGKTGIASGIGTDIEYLPIQPDLWIVTVFPDIHSSTPEAYSLCTPNEERDFDLKRVLTEEDPEEWRYMLENDLELPVIYHHKIVGDMKDHFYELGAVYASMSGSGSAVYGLFNQEFVAIDAFNSLAGLKFKVNVTPPSFSPDTRIYIKS